MNAPEFPVEKPGDVLIGALVCAFAAPLLLALVCVSVGVLARAAAWMAAGIAGA